MENIEIKVTKTNISITNGYVLNQGEYQVDKCKFTFSDEYTGLVKKAIFVDGSTSIDMVILNDECNIPYEILQNSNEFTLKVYGYQVQNDELVVRYSPTALKIFLREGSYVGSNEVITPSQFEQYEQALHNGLDDLSEAMETMETTVNAKLEEVDEALEDVETATTEANNLNLDVSKSGKVATVTLTKKDATTKVVTLSDGTSLMFQWDGTKLGIKTDEEESYTYVDLQGVQGEKGDTGAPFTIKKTYPSVQAMNADFNNMQLGDYVMIASSVDEEDNSKLYTRGESRWIFISDFSGGIGIQGETGLTPNIQIGTVVSGSTPSVTRTGTNENPILNFVLEKGDKGDKGNKGDTGATGNGISSIEKTAISGLVDTYTITYTNGTTSTFNVTNGEDGEVTQTQLDETNKRVDLNSKLRNALPKLTGTGTELTLNDTAEAEMVLELSGNTTQNTVILPDSHTQVDYIEATGAQYINPNMNVDTTKKLTYKTKVMWNDIQTNQNTGADYGAFFGVRDGVYRIGINSTSIVPSTTNYDDITAIIDIPNSKQSIEVNGVSSDEYLRTSWNATPIYIFCIFTSGGTITSCDCKMKYFEIYENDVLVKRFIPCYRNSDNVNGMYELVSGTFYWGRGGFGKGNNSIIPNPDFPQDIVSVTGNNSVKIVGKNLFDYATLQRDGNVVFEVQGGATLYRNAYISDRNNWGTYDKDMNLIETWYGIFPSDGSYTLPNNAKYVKTNDTNSRSNLYIGYSPNTEFTPYQSQTYPITLGNIEVCKIDNYKDFFFKNTLESEYYDSTLSLNKWYLKKINKKITLSTIANWTATNSGDTGVFYTNLITDYARENNVPFSNCFIGNTNVANVSQFYNLGNNKIGFSNISTPRLYIRCDELYDTSGDTTVFTEWLSNNNVELQYILATPENVLLNDTLQEQLDNIMYAYAYQNQTNIMQTNDGLPFIIDAEAIRDISNIINDLDSIIARIEALEGE